MHVSPSVNELNPSFKYLYPSICRAHTYKHAMADSGLVWHKVTLYFDLIWNLNQSVVSHCRMNMYVTAV